MSHVFIAVLLALLMISCASPEKKAQHLYDQGKYEEVIAKHPSTPLVPKAREKIAEGLLGEKRYEEILSTYGETPAASLAATQYAESLYVWARHEELLRRFPDSPAAMRLKQDQLDREKEHSARDKREQKAQRALNQAMLKQDNTKVSRTFKMIALQKVFSEYPDTKAGREAKQIYEEYRVRVR